MKKLLALDLSTTCTGYAIFDTKSKKLLKYGIIKPIKKGLSKLKYPEKQLYTIISVVEQIRDLLNRERLDLSDIIVIEQVNKHKNRISGLTLDALHAILWYKLANSYLKSIVYKDSDGISGWRPKLKLVLSDADKLNNKENRKLNKKLKKGTKKLTIINKKHLACRYVNKKFNLNLDVEKDSSDGDRADAIGLGIAYLMSK